MTSSINNVNGTITHDGREITLAKKYVLPLFLFLCFGWHGVRGVMAATGRPTSFVRSMVVEEETKDEARLLAGTVYGVSFSSVIL